ncbi:MAG: T9SS type A sorting domain-containing protein [Chlorobi bacterium]|nr:T9SS type A sorting domain-containing protein [Chlorobiota bacterium]
MRLQKLPLFLLFCFLLSVSGFGQNWEWKWSEQVTQKDAPAWSYIMNIDFQNNVYTGTMFGDSIFFGDTLFTTDSYYDWANWAIAEYDEHGEFQTAFDITSSENNLIFEVLMATDKNLNIYLVGEFQQEAHLLDTTIYHGNVSVPNSPELFVAKITPGLNVEWIQLISSNSQDMCQGLAVSSDNYLYMATKHFGNAGENDTVIYMGQDTVVFNTSFCSVLKIDFDGNIVWRKGLRSDEIGIDVREININHFNSITVNGDLRGDLYFSNDTVFHPHPGEYMHRPFIIEIDSSGELINGIIPDWNIVLSDSKRDATGNFFFAGFVWDTVYFASDTLIKHKDTIVNILAKLNTDYEPVWYETAKARKEQGSYYFSIDTFQDTLFFVGRCRGKFPMFDTVFNLGRYKGFIGKVTPEGKLDNFKIAESTGGFKTYNTKLDNCGNNLIIAGRFSGHIYFGADSLESYALGWDAIVSKLNLYDLPHFDFGPDTTICDSIRLVGPEGYKYYYWNGQLSEQNWFNVTQSGTYTFACTGEEGCWIRDTINIVVQPGFTIDIGQDTVIGLTDTLYLSVPDVYDSYLWSTGSTENSIIITGSTLGQGDWSVWVKVTQGVCSASDTIQLTVSHTDELQDMGVKIFPNPAGNVLQIQSERKFNKVELINNVGMVVISKRINNVGNKVSIDISDIPSGIYLIRIYFDDFAGNGKIIKL